MIDLRQKVLASHWLVGIIAGILGFIGISGFDQADQDFEHFDSVSLCYDVMNQIDPTSEGVLDYLPVLDDDYLAFKEALAFKESRGNYQAVNRFGYLGKYQFHMNTLKLMGIDDKHRFLRDSELQEQVFFWYAARNKWILRKDLKRSVGKRINGIDITESGILAAAHLAGAGNVKKYLRSGGTFAFEDAFGTSIEEYLIRFADFNLATLPAKDQWVRL